jgi:hypothetical protein
MTLRWCAFLARETLFVAALGPGFALAWFMFYYLAVWSA